MELGYIGDFIISSIFSVYVLHLFSAGQIHSPNMPAGSVVL